MNRVARSMIRFLLLGPFLLHSSASLHADGGTVRLSERRGGYRITVFTAPTPLRAGPVDVSVFVQDAATGEPIPEARITVRAIPRAHPGEAVCVAATAEAATNKLFQAALFELPEPGWWDVEIVIEGSRAPIRVRFEMEAAEALTRGWEWWPWIGWPALAIVLFGVHQRLVRRRRGPCSRDERLHGTPAIEPRFKAPCVR
jgi:hypothetical protein